MCVLLVLMEGVFDVLVCELLIEVNDYDFCIIEFVCVVDQLLLVKVFYCICLELYYVSCMLFGMLVCIQFLGQYLQWLVENVVWVMVLGLYGVDLNCGCLLKVVNGSGGGVILFKDFEFIYQGVKVMWVVVLLYLLVMVKVYFGWDSGDRKFEIVDVVQQVGVSELVVYGCIKVQGYCVEYIDWQVIGEICQCLIILVIVNGEIWDWQSVQVCMVISGCDVVMIGCGVLNIFNLSWVVKYNELCMLWLEVVMLL